MEVTETKITITNKTNKHFMEDSRMKKWYMEIMSGNTSIIIQLTKATVMYKHVQIILEIYVQQKDAKTI